MGPPVPGRRMGRAGMRMALSPWAFAQSAGLRLQWGLRCACGYGGAAPLLPQEHVRPVEETPREDVKNPAVPGQSWEPRPPSQPPHVATSTAAGWGPGHGSLGWRPTRSAGGSVASGGLRRSAGSPELGQIPPGALCTVCHGPCGHVPVSNGHVGHAKGQDMPRLGGDPPCPRGAEDVLREDARQDK